MTIVEAYNILAEIKPRDPEKRKAIEYILKYIEAEALPYVCEHYSKGLCMAGEWHPSVNCRGNIDNCIRNTLRTKVGD